MIKQITDKVKLNNGQEIFGLGLGVFQIPSEQTEEVVIKGIKAGYRLIDTAQIYGNEASVGKAIQNVIEEKIVKREELFITSKVWNNHLTYEETKEAFEQSLKNLGLDYLDLYLIHWPGKDAYLESWRALEDLYLEGKIKSIGVSNFEQTHLEQLLLKAKVVPVLNQIELHPKLTQERLRAFCKQHAIQVQAWSPLMQGQLLNHPVIEEIAKKYQKTSAQVILRWLIQQDILVNVKSVHENRMIQNTEIFDFTLTKEDMIKINNLNEDKRVGPHPNTFDFVL